jgi:CHAD domain-containing protein
MPDTEPTVIDRDDAPPAEAPSEQAPRRLSEIIESQLYTLQAHRAAVLETEDVEAIHKMRVTTRRLQASLDLLETKSDQLNVRGLKRQLRRWRRRLSCVRNYDVFLILLDREAASQRPAHREQFELVKAILQKRRTRNVERVREYLGRKQVSSIAAKLGVTLAAQAAETGEAHADASVEAKAAAVESAPRGIYAIDEKKVSARIADRLDQRLAEFQALAVQSHPATAAKELHELRIAAKRLRYLIEMVSELGHGNAIRALGWLRTLQDRIGEWHDLESLEAEIITLVSRPRFMKEHLAESSRMLQAAAHLQKKKDALVAKLFPVRVPRTLVLTSQRMAGRLRRAASGRSNPQPEEAEE